MADIEWCKKQKRGVKLIEPNDNLANEYLKSAEETLSVLRDMASKSNMWLATTKYYCEYFAVYALLMKIGIKSEIHECTIEVCRILEQENVLKKGAAKILENDKKMRIDNQYYLKNLPVKVDYSKIADFVLQIKDTLSRITSAEISRIRKLL